MTKRDYFLGGVLLGIALVTCACGVNDWRVPETQVLDANSTKPPLLTFTPNIEKGPYIKIYPESALVDEVVKIQVLDLQPGQIITLRASMNDDADLKWESYATFVADNEGVIDVASQAPLSGTYDAVDPMGLIWSMLPKVPGSEYPYFANWYTSFVLITLIAEFEGEEIATTHIKRIRLNSDVQKILVSENGLVGYFFIPNPKGQNPGLIILGGSDGSVDTTMAALLNFAGYATLALAYFGSPTLPGDLTEIPLEYFETAIDWLKSQEAVNGNQIGVIGTSRGGELALLLGATFPDIKAVIGYAASGVVAGNYSRSGAGQKAAWTFGGEPVPFYISEDNKDEATIAVEKINGRILLISGKDDLIWSSTELSEVVIARLQKHHHSYQYEHLAYKDAGHIIGVPYWPTSGNMAVPHPISGVEFTAGGSPAGNAQANADSVGACACVPGK